MVRCSSGSRRSRSIPDNAQANSYVDYVRDELRAADERASPRRRRMRPFGIERRARVPDRDPARRADGRDDAPMYMDPIDEGWFIDDERATPDRARFDALSSSSRPTSRRSPSGASTTRAPRVPAPRPPTSRVPRLRRPRLDVRLRSEESTPRLQPQETGVEEARPRVRAGRRLEHRVARQPRDARADAAHAETARSRACREHPPPSAAPRRADVGDATPPKTARPGRRRRAPSLALPVVPARTS